MKIIIFGAGHYGNLALEYYGYDAVAFFCDNNSKKIGQMYCGKRIISFKQLKKIHIDYKIIVAIESLEIYFQIAKQLAQNGVENYEAFTYENIFYNKFKEKTELKYIEIKENKMLANYDKNKNLLRNYPYLFGEIPEFKYYQNAILDLDEEIPCFFKDLSKPLFIRNLSHPVHIKFLFDNVRASEDVTMENHIYLYYENERKFLEMLCKCSLKPLLKGRKFVFLVGKQNKNVYPIDFKNKYNIDYDSMEFKPLRANEFKRIVMLQNFSSHGQDFLFQISAVNRNILPVFVNRPFDYLPKLKKEILKFKFDINDLFCFRWYSMDMNYYSLQKPEIFRFISMVLYNNREQDRRERISPTILLDPHNKSHYLFADVYKSFQYRKSIRLIRNPIAAYASVVNYNFFSKAFNGIPNCKAYLAPHYNSTSVFGKFDKLNCFKLESLKANPEICIKVLCDFFQVPFDKNMLHPEKLPYIEVCRSSTGKNVMGFESTPPRDISEFLSEWDLQRLMPIYEPILRHYGYECKKHAPLKENNLRKIYSEPFKFEKNLKISDRDLYTEVLLYLYKLAKSGEYYLAPFIDIEQ
ncbi:MAG: hypothetical protein FWC26_14930 [Fibromonadales bacterium]|nr:hypothetical protein [Fibromonadales bacterium]